MLKTGDIAPNFEVLDIFNNSISIDKFRGKKVLLSFYRYISCPFCNLRIMELKEKYPSLQEKGLEIIAIFHSTQDNILSYQGVQSLNFPIIPDPEENLYKLYDIQSSFFGMLKTMMHPEKLWQVLKNYGLHIPKPEGDINTIPADFLINPDGSIHTAHYGKDIGDHIPFEEIETFLN